MFSHPLEQAITSIIASDIFLEAITCASDETFQKSSFISKKLSHETGSEIRTMKKIPSGMKKPGLYPATRTQLRNHIVVRQYVLPKQLSSIIEVHPKDKPKIELKFE
ncbi:hypothetical protein QQG55_34605 [Brugia pahangi]